MRHMLISQIKSKMMLSYIQIINKKEYNLIDVIKYIMSIFIIMLHAFFYNDIYNVYIRNFILSLLCLAVPFFFVTAGFFLFRSSILPNYNMVKFTKYKNRILRMYIIWFIISVPISLAYNMGDTLNNTLIYLKLFIFNGYGHLWFLWGLFLSIIFIRFLLKRHIPVTVILFIGFILFIINRLYSHYGSISSSPELLRYIYENKIINVYGITSSILYVSMGGYIAQKGVLKSNVLLIILFIVGIVIIFLSPHKNVSVGLPIATYSLFGIVAQVQLSNKKQLYKIIRFHSTFIYLFHMIVLMILMHDFHIEYGYILTFLTFVGTFAVSICVFYLKDKRYFVFLRKMI